MANKTISHLAIWVCFALGLGLLAQGAWIPAKAQLAQILLERAWSKSLASGIPTKPWPWADTTASARLYNKRLGISLVVLEGISGEVLAFGPGRQRNSATFDESGNKILAGHRDTSFSFLQNLRPGDEIGIETLLGNQQNYVVRGSSIQLADNIFLEPTQQSWLTLITCYPFDSIIPGGQDRFLIFAEEV